MVSTNALVATKVQRANVMLSKICHNNCQLLLTAEKSKSKQWLFHLLIKGRLFILNMIR